MVVNPPKPGVSERSKIDSFIVMDLMRDAAAKQRELEASGSNQRVLHLEVGQPSTGAPSHVKQAASHALQGDKLGYTEAFGIRPLRERIARHYKDQYSVEITLDDVAITTGSSGAFVVVFTAAFDPGDRVAMAAPGYPCYRNILGSLGVDVVQMPVSSASNWQPTVEMLEELVKDGKPLKGLIIASPSNPTGTILSPAELKGICDFCARNGVRLISDEIYHGITIEGDTACALTYNPDAIVINSFSKYFSMTGWRLGWVVCKDLALKKALEALLQNLFISAPTLSQQAGGRACKRAHGHARTHVRTRARARTHTHTHTHACMHACIQVWQPSRVRTNCRGMSHATRKMHGCFRQDCPAQASRIFPAPKAPFICIATSRLCLRCGAFRIAWLCANSY